MAINFTRFGWIIGQVIIKYGSAPIDIITVGVNDETFHPNKFELKQNYPNPFNPNTTIEFSLANNSDISLRIYDLTGKEITTLFDEFRNAGTYKEIFDASKYGLASGIYFYRLNTNEFTKTKPMMLLK